MSSNSPVQLSGFPVPLSTTAHQWARQFAAAQATPQKGKQVYLNTLAVWAVQHYLSWFHIKTEWQQSDSWDDGMRAMFDVADLTLPGLGTLECRPLLPNQAMLPLPIAPGDRIGYVAVQFAEQLHEVQLLGFVAASQLAEIPEMLPINSLQPLETLFDCLAELQPAISPLPTVHLSQWLQQQFETGWQTVEEILGRRSLSLAFRWVPVQRAKQIDLAGQPLALIITLTSVAEPLALHLQLCSIDEHTPLPAHLRLRILAAGEVFQEITTAAADRFIQYEFTAEPGETFKIELSCQGISRGESFVV